MMCMRTSLKNIQTFFKLDNYYNRCNVVSIVTRAITYLLLTSTLLLPGCAGQEKASETLVLTPTISIITPYPSTHIPKYTIIPTTPDIAATKEKTYSETHFLTIDEKFDLNTYDWEDHSKIVSLTIIRNSADCEYILSLPIMKQLKYLSIYCKSDDPFVIDIKTLRNCFMLRDISLDNVIIKDIRFISHMPLLQEVDISDADVRCDLSSLSRNKLLSHLSFRNSQIKYIRTLPQSFSIENLSIIDCDVSDLTALSGMKNLQYLYLNNNNISNIEPLRGLSKLRLLILTGNKVSDFSPLKGTTELTELYATCDSEKVTIIDSFAYLEKIDTLYLYDAHITDISPLKNMRNMWMLRITGENNTFSDIKPIKYLKDMISLELESNGILVDLTPIIGADNLTYINLYFSGFGDLSPLAQRDNIFNLIIETDSSIDLYPLASMTAIEEFTLRAEITTDDYIDITPLTRIASLKHVYLEGNGIVDVTPFKDAGQNLEYLSITDAIGIDQVKTLLETAPDYFIRYNYKTICIGEDIDQEWLEEAKSNCIYCKFAFLMADEWYKLGEAWEIE